MKSNMNLLTDPERHIADRKVALLCGLKDPTSVLKSLAQNKIFEPNVLRIVFELLSDFALAF